MSHPITDKRGKVVHLTNDNGKPMCRPTTDVSMHATFIGRNGSKLCNICAERELRARYENGER